MKSHKHAEVIKKWADGREIECRDYPNTEWERCAKPTWHELGEYRVKPEPPAKVYPETKMTGLDFATAAGRKIYRPSDVFDFQARGIANAAIRHAIDSGQVVPLSEIAAYTDKHDMAVAEAVCREASAMSQFSTDDLVAIIAGVAP